MTLHNAGASDEQLAADAANIREQLGSNAMSHPHVVHDESAGPPSVEQLAAMLNATARGADPRRP